MFRVRRLALLSGAACGVAFQLAGCAANCLRDSDCEDTQVCQRDSCVLRAMPGADAGPESAESAGSAGSAGSTGSTGSADSTGSAGGTGAGSLPPDENGGAGGFAGSAPAVGGSSQDARENLDASADPDAASN